MVILYLTCANEEEANVIAKELLDKKLVSCVRQSKVKSSYWWEGRINHGNEVLLMLESKESLFDEIDKEVTKIHSYDEYVLTMVKVDKTTPGVEKWLNDSLCSQ